MLPLVPIFGLAPLLFGLIEEARRHSGGPRAPWPRAHTHEDAGALLEWLAIHVPGLSAGNIEADASIWLDIEGSPHQLAVNADETITVHYVKLGEPPEVFGTADSLEELQVLMTNAVEFAQAGMLFGSTGSPYGQLIGQKADLGSELVSNWSPALRTIRAQQHSAMARGAAGAGQMRQANWLGQHAYNQAFQLRALGQPVPESVWYASRQAWNQDTRGQPWQPPGGASLFEQYPTEPWSERLVAQGRAEGIFP